jgi:hypothetical protein
MRRRLLSSFVITSIIVAACSEQTGPPTSPRVGPVAAARAPSVPTPNVTSTVYDADASGNLLLTRSDDQTGAGSATYTSGNKISSHITSNGAWQLYLGSQTTRTLYLVLASQGIPAPDGYYSASIEAYSQCFDQNDSQVSMLSMSAGESNGNCSFGMDFSYGSTKYKLVMSPRFAGTGRATVTCDIAAGGYCTHWTIAPNAAAANAGVANLYHYSPRGSLIFDGVYHNSFSITAAE